MVKKASNRKSDLATDLEAAAARHRSRRKAEDAYNRFASAACTLQNIYAELHYGPSGENVTGDAAPWAGEFKSLIEKIARSTSSPRRPGNSVGFSTLKKLAANVLEVRRA